MFNIRNGVLVCAFLYASSAAAQGSSDQTYLDFEVERAARVRQPEAPQYPERLRTAKVPGEVLVQFVVDERGAAQMQTFKVIKSNDNAFSESVRKAVAGTSFHPAEIDGKKVKQLVQQPFRFQPTR